MDRLQAQEVLTAKTALGANRVYKVLRHLREDEAKLWPEFGHGRTGPVLPNHAVNSIVGLCCIGLPADCPRAVKAYRALVPSAVNVFRIYDDGAEQWAQAEGDASAFLFAAMRDTLGDLLDGVVSGIAAGINPADPPVFTIRVLFWHSPSIRAEVRLTWLASEMDEAGRAYRKERRISCEQLPLPDRSSDLTLETVVALAPEQIWVLSHGHFQLAGELARGAVQQARTHASVQEQVSEALAEVAAAVTEERHLQVMPRKKEAGRAATHPASQTRRPRGSRPCT